MVSIKFVVIKVKLHAVVCVSTPTWSQHGSEKVVNEMNVTINLLTLMTADLVLVQFCELLIYRSSSTVG